MSPMGDSSTPQYQPRNMVSSWFSASPPDLVMTTIFPSISRPTSGWPRRQWRRINQSEPCKVLCVFKTWCEIHLYIFLFFSISYACAGLFEGKVLYSMLDNDFNGAVCIWISALVLQSHPECCYERPLVTIRLAGLGWAVVIIIVSCQLSGLRT